MASDADYLNYILDRLSLLDGITYRPMMGEYILYYQGISPLWKAVNTGSTPLSRWNSLISG